MNETPSDRSTILIVDDTPANLSVLLDYLPQHGFKVLVARSGERALEQVKHGRPDVILLDAMMPGLDGFETCRRLKADDATRDIPVIFMTALSDTNHKVRAFEAGAVDFVTKPFQHEELLARVTTHRTLRQLRERLEDVNRELELRVEERTAELKDALREVEQLKNRLQAENVYLQEEIKVNHNFEAIIGGSAKLKSVLAKVEQVAGTPSTVLILGETGTGKELIARAVHDLSARRERPLVKVNCGALPSGLIESELFGHEKGAFTGAVARKMGRFELADGGTLFLDEVGDLPLELQVKLLRVLQEGEFERLGATSTVKVDVRLIAATHRDLRAAIEERKFREDLYYRLNVFPIELPALRERSEDIPLLVRHFIDRFSGTIGERIDTIPAGVMERLQAHRWPGNVRELANVVERSLIHSSGGIFRLEDALDGGAAPPPAPAAAAAGTTLRDVERDHITRVLEDAYWRIEGDGGAARRLGMKPSTLRSRMRKLGIARPGFEP